MATRNIFFYKTPGQLQKYLKRVSVSQNISDTFQSYDDKFLELDTLFRHGVDTRSENISITLQQNIANQSIVGFSDMNSSTSLNERIGNTAAVVPGNMLHSSRGKKCKIVFFMTKLFLLLPKKFYQQRNLKNFKTDKNRHFEHAVYVVIFLHFTSLLKIINIVMVSEINKLYAKFR